MTGNQLLRLADSACLSLRASGSDLKSKRACAGDSASGDLKSGEPGEPSKVREFA